MTIARRSETKLPFHVRIVFQSRCLVHGASASLSRQEAVLALEARCSEAMKFLLASSHISLRYVALALGFESTRLTYMTYKLLSPGKPTTCADSELITEQQGFHGPAVHGFTIRYMSSVCRGPDDLSYLVAR